MDYAQNKIPKPLFDQAKFEGQQDSRMYQKIPIEELSLKTELNSYGLSRNLHANCVYLKLFTHQIEHSKLFRTLKLFYLR